MKVLLAIDGSACSDQAVKEVSYRPWPVGSEVKIVSTFEMPLPATPEGWALPPTYLEEMDRTIKKQAETTVERAIELLKSRLDASIRVESEVLPGSPRAVILDVANSWGADLIVVGSHGYRAWERFLLGSVSQAVVSHAKCSVEVVRCRNKNTEATKDLAIAKL